MRIGLFLAGVTFLHSIGADGVTAIGALGYIARKGSQAKDRPKKARAAKQTTGRKTKRSGQRVRRAIDGSRRTRATAGASPEQSTALTGCLPPGCRLVLKCVLMF